MGVVTISRQYGSEGRRVGILAAEALGYRYMDKEIITRVAIEAGVPISEVASFDEQPEHPIMRALRKFLAPPSPHRVADMGEVWGSSVPLSAITGEPAEGYAIFDEDAYVKMTQKVILSLANEGNVVVMGRGGRALLSDRPDALHVRVVAPEAFRVQKVMEGDGLSSDEAAERIEKVDEQRARYTKRHYGIGWEGPELYHLVLNTGMYSVARSARLVAEAVRGLEAQEKDTAAM